MSRAGQQRRSAHLGVGSRSNSSSLLDDQEPPSRKPPKPGSTKPRAPEKPLPSPPTAPKHPVNAVKSTSRRDSVNVDGVMGFEDLLDEPDRMLLDGERGHVSIATAKWGFEGRNASELSFPPGGVIRVLEPHESGWWTGEYRGAIGFFPVNRTDPQLLDMTAYHDISKRRHLKPMFVEGEVVDAPALPTAAQPMLKAAKLLGVTENEALALSPRASTGPSSPGPSSPSAAAGRPDRAGSVEAGSSRKALAVMGFDDESPRNRERKGSALIQKISKLTVRRLTQSSSSVPSNTSGTNSPRSTAQAPASGASPRKEASPREVKFAPDVESDRSRSASVGSPIVEPRRPPPPATVPPAAAVVAVADAVDSWDDDDVNESNLLY